MNRGVAVRDVESGAASKRRKRWTFRIAAVLLGLALSFAALEIATRLTRPRTDLWAITGRKSAPHPMSFWAEPDAFCAYRGRPGHYGTAKVRKTVNRHGFVSTPEIDYKKSPGEIRIVYLGESSTAGTGRDMADDETWPWKATRRVQDALPKDKVTFINGALGGYTSFESYGRLWSRLRFFAPDIVVVYHGWNEMYYLGNPDRARRWRSVEDGSWPIDRPRRLKVIEPAWADHFLRYSQLLAKMRVYYFADLGQGEVGSGSSQRIKRDFNLSALDVWRTNLRLMRDTAEHLGIDLFVCKQATLIVPGLSDAERRRCSYHDHGFNHDAHVRAYEAIYRVIDEEISPSRIIDATSISGHSESFYDHVHLTDLGTSRLAQIVADRLIDQLAPKAAGPQ